ncbi:MAG: hypothetical protein JNL90_16655 [Planctomycetes bacterium]|nr:hypothetical protein [Planctomycetota bacterium]
MDLRSSAALLALLMASVAPLPAAASAANGGAGVSGVPAPLVVARAPLRDELATLAEQLAVQGRDEESEALRLALAALGHPAGELVALETRCARAADERPRHARRPPLPRAAETVARIATSLNRELALVDPVRRLALARWIVRLDEQQPLAQQVLGRVPHEERFVDPQEERCAERRAALAAAIEAARSLPIELAPQPFDDGSVTLTTFGRRAASSLPFLRYGQLEFVGTLPRAQLDRLVRGALQATALSEFARGRPLAVPEPLQRARARLVLIDSPAAYRTAIDEAAAAGGLTAGAAEAARFHSGFGAWFDDARGHCVMNATSERNSYAALLLWLGWKWLPDGLQPALVAGHLDWLSLTCFGTRMPEPLERLEARFEAWLRPRAGGVAQRLAQRDPRDAERLAKAETELLAELDAIRRAAAEGHCSAPPLFFDRALSRGCVAHADFLLLHPERLTRWPAMHEQLTHERASARRARGPGRMR